MEKIRIFVADGDVKQAQEIERYFKLIDSVEIIGVMHNGLEAFNYMRLNRANYDIVIMDLLMAEADGAYILKELDKIGYDKPVIVTSAFYEDAVVKTVLNYSCRYFMMKPYALNVLEDRIYFVYSLLKDGSIANLNAIISEILHKLGVPSHIKGYLYLREGIKMIYQKKGNILITKEVYPAIAEMFVSSPSRVERSIRHAIETSWSRGDLDYMNELFGNSVDIDRDRPTNSEYMNTIADKIRLDRDTMKF